MTQILKLVLDLVVLTSTTYKGFAKGNFSDTDAQNAFDLIASRGKLYFTLGTPASVRICLGGGFLTALNKVASKEGATPDARL
jgi:hypothetical protein